MAIGFLGHLEVSQHAPGFLPCAGRDETTAGLHQVSRPYQVVPAQVVVAFREAPGNGQTGDHAAFHTFGFVHA